MGIFSKKKKNIELTAGNPFPKENFPKVTADFNFESPIDWTWASLFQYYNGEKNKGEVGPIVNYYIDHKNMSKRVNQALLTNDVAKMIINRYVKWIVSRGLDLELNPNVDVLKHFNININAEELNDQTESFFSIWAGSKTADYRGNETFYQLQKTAFKSALANGDILTIMRWSKDDGVTVELIDSERLMNPVVDGEIWKNGVRLNQRGQITGFCVSSPNNPLGYEIIDAYNKKLGIQQAFLYKRDKNRCEDVRGLSSFSGSLDKLAKIDRYVEATVAASEERAKIVYSIEHDLNGTGENPLDKITAAIGGVQPNDSNPRDFLGENLANKIAATTNSQTYNMTQGSKLVMHAAPTDKGMGEFVDKIIDIIAGSVGIPPNVVRMLYTDSFSASRAAINDWQHTIKVDRDEFTSGWLRPVFTYWFTLEAMFGVIDAEPYLAALDKGNKYVTDAYTRCEFVGEMFPHIDPMKEVNAERAKLGPLYDNIPLTTYERAARQLGNVNSDSIIQQSADELKKYTKELDIKEN